MGRLLEKDVHQTVVHTGWLVAKREREKQREWYSAGPATSLQ
jgi:hypothetical protein